MSVGASILSLLVAFAMLVLRATCRVRLHDDPRPALRDSNQPYVYSILHAHQVSIAIRRERNTMAMVSQSRDGQLLMPAFWALGIKTARGSNSRSQGDRGGRAALDSLIRHVAHEAPAIIAVDGPRGPRNGVRKGIAVLAQRSSAAVVNVVAIPTRRWIMVKAWDRLQIPQPFSRIDAYFAPPVTYEESEGIEAFRKRIEQSLNALEAEHDPAEFRHAGRTRDGSPPLSEGTDLSKA